MAKPLDDPRLSMLSGDDLSVLTEVMEVFTDPRGVPPKIIDVNQYNAGPSRPEKEKKTVPAIKVAALWKPTKKDSKAVLNGRLKIPGLDREFRVSLFQNTDRRPDSNDPEFHLVAFDEAEKPRPKAAPTTGSLFE